MLCPKDPQTKRWLIRRQLKHLEKKKKWWKFW